MIRFSSNGGGGVGVNNAGSNIGALDNSHGICFSFSNFALLIKKNSPLGRAEAIQCCYMVVVAKALAKEHFSMKIKSQFPALHMAEKKVQLFNFIHSHWYTVVGNIFGRQKIMNLDTTFSPHGICQTDGTLYVTYAKIQEALGVGVPIYGLLQYLFSSVQAGSIIS